MVHNQRRRGQKSNANNQRVKKTNTDTNETTLYAWTSDRIFGEYDAQGTPLQETVYLGNTPVGIIKSEGVYRIYADQIHAPRMITENLNNQTLWEWSSQPFGETQPNEDVDNDSIKLSYNLRFPGQYYDQESHKYYNYNRYYDPSTGSYMMSDPMGLLGGLNSYGYVDANPLINFDQSGLTTVHETDILIYPPETNCSFTKQCHDTVVKGGVFGKIVLGFFCSKVIGVPFVGAVCDLAVWSACGTLTNGACTNK